MICFPSPTSLSTTRRKSGQRPRSRWQPSPGANGFISVSGTPQNTEPHSHPHGKSQPRLLQTYLFMKCEVMKKVLNPTTVLTLTVLSRSAGTQGCCPVGPPLPTPQEGTRDPATTYPTARQHRQGEASKAAQMPHAPNLPPSAMLMQSPKLRRGCSVAVGEGAVARVGKEDTRMGKGKNPVIANGWFGGGEPASGRTQVKGPAGASPFLISLKCSRTEPSPQQEPPSQTRGFYIYIKKANSLPILLKKWYKNTV